MSAAKLSRRRRPGKARSRSRNGEISTGCSAPEPTARAIIDGRPKRPPWRSFAAHRALDPLQPAWPKLRRQWTLRGEDMTHKTSLIAAAILACTLGFAAPAQAGTCQPVTAKGVAKNIATATKYAQADLKQTAKALTKK